MHIYTDYKITNKPLSDMTLLQYNAILKITDEIIRFKSDNKPLVVV